MPTPTASSSPSSHVLQLLPERVAGKRIMMGYFKKYRLGKPAEVKKLLEAHGATVLGATSRQPFDFVLGGCQAEDTGGFASAIVFEEELCAPVAATDELAYFRPRLWPMLRELLTHPLIRVSWLSVGLPMEVAAIDKLARKLKQPLPRLLRAFYQQVGELRLHWYWTVPAKEVYVNQRMGSWPDAVDGHAGVINIFTLAKVLSAEWFDPQMCFALTPSQRMFDFYNDYHMMAVDLASGDDPLLLVGDDYGISFSDYGSIHLSEYLPLLLDTYGLNDGVRNGPPEEMPVDLDQKSGLNTPELIGKALSAYLLAVVWRMPDVRPEFQQRQEARFWELLDYAQHHHPEQSPQSWHRVLRQRLERSKVEELPWLPQPRYQSLLPAVRAEVREKNYLFIDYPHLDGHVMLINNSVEPLIATNYTLTLSIGEPGQEILLGAADAAPADFRVEVAPQQWQEFKYNFSLLTPELWAALAPVGITEQTLRAAARGKHPKARLKLVVDCGPAGPLRDEYEVELH